MWDDKSTSNYSYPGACRYIIIMAFFHYTKWIAVSHIRFITLFTTTGIQKHYGTYPHAHYRTPINNWWLIHAEIATITSYSLHDIIHIKSLGALFLYIYVDLLWCGGQRGPTPGIWHLSSYIRKGVMARNHPLVDSSTDANIWRNPCKWAACSLNTSHL